MYAVDFSVLKPNLEFILLGIKVTLIVSIVSMILSFLIGSIIFYFRFISNKAINNIMMCFVELIKNTPLLIQLYILYKGFPSIGILIPSMYCAIIALSVYTAVYISEVFRSGENFLKQEIVSTAKSLGLSEFQTFIYIVYPLTLKSIIPPLCSQFINLVKNSSLVSFIAVVDVFYVIYKGIADDFRMVEYFILGVCIYSFFTLFIAFITNLLEKKYAQKGIV